MKKKILTWFALLAAMVMFAGMTAMAAPQTMADGATFDPEFYATHNPDVVAVYGTSAKSLYKHYSDYGKYEGRQAFEGDAATAHTPVYPGLLQGQDTSYVVEVSLGEQHMWCYQGGNLVLNSPVVTGTVGVHDTPGGIFQIIEKVPGKYLVGDDYKNWVDYWMRLTWSGIGLHDATWRKSFGGTIYQRSGSHGCINLPYGVAANLYNIVPMGTWVIIY